MGALLWKAGVPILVALAVYFLPVPDGVEPTGMQMLGIFLGTILALILQPLPTGSVALIGMAAAMLTKTEPASKALAGFANTTVWLIARPFIAEGFLITGLGRRIGLLFVTRLGSSTLGLAYGMALTDLILAPATPSNTARCGGVVFPVVASLSHLEDSNPAPEDSRKRMGAFLALTALQVNVVTSAMFLTAMAGNPCVGGGRQAGGESPGANGRWRPSCPASSALSPCPGDVEGLPANGHRDSGSSSAGPRPTAQGRADIAQ